MDNLRKNIGSIFGIVGGVASFIGSIMLLSKNVPFWLSYFGSLALFCSIPSFVFSIIALNRRKSGKVLNSLIIFPIIFLMLGGVIQLCGAIFGFDLVSEAGSASFLICSGVEAILSSIILLFSRKKNEESVEDKLNNLFVLFEKGIITKEEYEAKRASLIEKL